ncbi:MAG: hypothetical protein LBO09_09615 [Candidatus Peribacteria bacterium]|jgi:hypothetical protein|nr:hypothetical protein [Candidatus Peribacteria bacterium]
MSDSPEKLQAPVEEKMQSESNEDKLKSKEEIIVKNPDVPKKTAESMQKNPIFREKAKTMLEKGVKNLIEK